MRMMKGVNELLFQTLRLLTSLEVWNYRSWLRRAMHPVVGVVEAGEAKQLAFYKNGKKQLRLEAQDDVYVPQRIESRDDR